MQDPGYCELYIATRESIAEMQAAIDMIYADIFKGMALEIPAYHNEDFVALAQAGSRFDFLEHSPYCLDVGLDDDYPRYLSAFQFGVAILVEELRGGGRIVVASCSFEDLVARETGWNWSEEQPAQPDWAFAPSAWGLWRRTTPRDLLPEFQAALAGRLGWRDDHVLCCLQVLQSSTAGSTVDWDDGEGWGRIFLPGRVIAYVCAHASLVLVRADYAPLLPGAIDGVELVTVVFADEATGSYAVDPEILNKIFAIEVTPHIDYTRATLDDIRYATV